DRAGADLGEAASARDRAVEKQGAASAEKRVRVEENVTSPDARAAAIEVAGVVDGIDRQSLIGDLDVVQKQVGVAVDDRAHRTTQDGGGRPQGAVSRDGELAVVDGGDAIVTVRAAEFERPCAVLDNPCGEQWAARASTDDGIDPHVRGSSAGGNVIRAPAAAE